MFVAYEINVFTMKWPSLIEKNDKNYAFTKKKKSGTSEPIRKMRIGVNFINVLRATFMRADTKSAKKTVKSSSFFVLSGSVSVKDACRTLMKLTLGLYYLQESGNLKAI